MPCLTLTGATTNPHMTPSFFEVILYPIKQGPIYWAQIMAYSDVTDSPDSCILHYERNLKKNGKNTHFY